MNERTKLIASSTSSSFFFTSFRGFVGGGGCRLVPFSMDGSGRRAVELLHVSIGGGEMEEKENVRVLGLDENLGEEVGEEGMVVYGWN